MFNKVFEARYTNNAKDTIYVLFEDLPEDGTQEMYIEPGSPDHEALTAAGVDEEALLDMTGQYAQLQAREVFERLREVAYDQFDEIYKQAEKDHKKRIQELAEKQAQRLTDSELTNQIVTVFEQVLEKNGDKDIVFACKVKILEEERVRKSKDKELKAKIRKATTLLELMTLYDEHFREV